MGQGESERCEAPTAQARSSRDSISHHCILSLKALNSNDVGYWHKADVRLGAPEGRFTGGLLTLGTKIGKLPASEFSLARNQAANPSNEGVGFDGTGPPRAT